MKQILKFFALLLAALVLMHWLTAGHDEIIEGPYHSSAHTSITYI